MKYLTLFIITLFFNVASAETVIDLKSSFDNYFKTCPKSKAEIKSSLTAMVNKSEEKLSKLNELQISEILKDTTDETRLVTYFGLNKYSDEYAVIETSKYCSMKLKSYLENKDKKNETELFENWSHCIKYENKDLEPMIKKVFDCYDNLNSK